VGAVARFGTADRDGNPRRFEQIIGNSTALESVLEQVQRVAPTDSTALILGETGTGKELIAPRDSRFEFTGRASVHKAELCSHSV